MRIRSILSACLLCCFTTILAAQTISTAQIRGTVQDPSGAAIPDAQVTLIQTATGTGRTVVSGADGGYVFVNLSPATYRLEVTKPSFKKLVQTGIVLDIGSNPTINVTLQLGAVTQQVEVNSGTVMVETQTANVGTLVSSTEVQQLPLNGREMTDLLQFTGATNVNTSNDQRTLYGTAAADATTLTSVAGSMIGDISYYLDGGLYMDPLGNVNLPFPFPDAVQEFKVETSSSPAQYGVHSGGDVSVVTKSGTNQTHGDLFEYVRNYMFDSRFTGDSACAPAPGDNATNNPDTRCPRDNLKRNQFGGTIGGAIKKDKLFYFLGFQDSKQSSTTNMATSTPTADMLAGNFQPCLGTTPLLAAPFGTGTMPNGQPAGPNQINPAMYSTVIGTLTKGLPPSNPNINPCGQNAYIYTQPVRYTEYQGIAKVDYNVTKNNSLSARYFNTNFLQPSMGQPKLSNGSTNLILASVVGTADQVQTLSVAETYLWRLNTVNTARIMGNRAVNDTILNDETIDLADMFSAAGVTGNVYQVPAGTGSTKLLPGMAMDGVSNSLTSPLAESPNGQAYDTLEFADDVSMTRGRHLISLGLDFSNTRSFAYTGMNANGTFTFDGTATGLGGRPTGASGFPDFLMGETSAGTPFQQSSWSPQYTHQNLLGIYAQDAWKVTPRLTVTGGLRWTPFLAHTGPMPATFSLQNAINNVHSTLYPNAPAGYLFNGDTGAPTGNKYTNNKLNQWSPRIGIAWDPKGDGKTSIRAGFGIFYDFPNMAFDQMAFEEPWGGIVTAPAAAPCESYPCNSDLANPWQGFSFVTGSGQVVNGNPYPTYVGAGPKGSAYVPSATVFSYPQSITPPEIMHYNLSIQRLVTSSWMVSATFIGTQMRHLWSANFANPSFQGPSIPYPLPAGVSFTPGPCPAGVPPFACYVPGPGGANLGAANLNLMLQNYGSHCAAPGAPAGSPTSCYGDIYMLDEGGTGNYNGLLLSATHRFENHFTATTNYTWSHCISMAYTMAIGMPLDINSVPFDPEADRGGCQDIDVRQTLGQTLVAQMPEFLGHSTMFQYLVGNWQMSGDANLRSGTVLSLQNAPITLIDYSGFGGGSWAERLNLVPGKDPYCQPITRSCFLNPAAYTTPAAYTQGSLPANWLYGPHYYNVDFALAKTIPITERQQLMIRWENFNVLNHVNMTLPSAIAPVGGFTPGFGEPAAPAPAIIPTPGYGTAGGPRIMQFAMKYTF